MSSKLAEAEEPEPGKVYEIKDVEKVTTDIRGFRGFRLILTEVKTGKERVTMLWERPVVGKKSKLGAFYSAFRSEYGNDYTNTDLWKGHRFEVISWIERNREIKLLPKKKA